MTSNSFRALCLWWRSYGCLLLCYCCSQKIFIKDTAAEQQRKMFSGVDLVSLLPSFPSFVSSFPVTCQPTPTNTLKRREKGGERKSSESPDLFRPVTDMCPEWSDYKCTTVSTGGNTPPRYTENAFETWFLCVHVQCDCLRDWHPQWTKNKTTGRIYYTLSDLHTNHCNVITTCLASRNLPVFAADVCLFP